MEYLILYQMVCCMMVLFEIKVFTILVTNAKVWLLSSLTLQSNWLLPVPLVVPAPCTPLGMPLTSSLQKLISGYIHVASTTSFWAPGSLDLVLITSLISKLGAEIVLFVSKWPRIII